MIKTIIYNTIRMEESNFLFFREKVEKEAVFHHTLFIYNVE